MYHGRRTLPIEGEAAPLVEARFIPPRYEPNYAYPLLVLLHGRGGDEEQLVHSMGGLAWRNYVALGLRGTEEIVRKERLVGYGWGRPFARRDRRVAPSAAEPALTDGETFDRILRDGWADPLDQLEDRIFSAIQTTMRALHVHSERIFLVGSGEGAAVAYRMGLSYPERFAGVVAINGWLPDRFRPLGRLKETRELRVLAVHGEWNTRAPVQDARKDVAILRAGGLQVAYQSYPCAHRITPPMMADIDTWLIKQCTGQVQT
ncbi:MAG: esterase [Isosphaeraceae bacterium]